jgi:hypothetical protein
MTTKAPETQKDTASSNTFSQTLHGLTLLSPSTHPNFKEWDFPSSIVACQSFKKYFVTVE